MSLYDSAGSEGPIAGGEFPSWWWAWVFKWFESYTPRSVAVEQTEWRGFSTWGEATRWADQVGEFAPSK